MPAKRGQTITDSASMNSDVELLIKDFVTLYVLVRFPVTSLDAWYEVWHGKQMELLVARAGTSLPEYAKRPDVESLMLEIAATYLALPESIVVSDAAVFGILLCWSIYFTQPSQPRQKVRLSAAAAESLHRRFSRLDPPARIGRDGAAQHELLRSILRTLSYHGAFELSPFVRGVHCSSLVVLHELQLGGSLLLPGVIPEGAGVDAGRRGPKQPPAATLGSLVPEDEQCELDQALREYESLKRGLMLWFFGFVVWPAHPLPLHAFLCHPLIIQRNSPS